MAWIADVESKISIPDYEPTVPGDCIANHAAAIDLTRCWWECQGCAGPDDIRECNTPGYWGLSFDGGPGPYTPNLLEYLDEKGLKATFFVYGDNVVEFPHTLQAQYASGHQIGVKSWSEQALTRLTNAEIVAELGWGRKVVKDVSGVTPAYFRPPFMDLDVRVRAIAGAMGLTPVLYTGAPSLLSFRIDDNLVQQGRLSSQEVLWRWHAIMMAIPSLSRGFIMLQHDGDQASVDIATGYIIPQGVASPNLIKTIGPIIKCLEMPLSNAYIETRNNRALRITSEGKSIGRIVGITVGSIVGFVAIVWLGWTLIRRRFPRLPDGKNILPFLFLPPKDGTISNSGNTTFHSSKTKLGARYGTRTVSIQGSGSERGTTNICDPKGRLALDIETPAPLAPTAERLAVGELAHSVQGQLSVAQDGEIFYSNPGQNTDVERQIVRHEDSGVRLNADVGSVIELPPFYSVR